MMQTARGLHWWAGPFCLHIRGIAYWEQGSTQKCLPTRLATNLTPSVYFLPQTEFKRKNPTGCGAPHYLLKNQRYTFSILLQITALGIPGRIRPKQNASYGTPLSLFKHSNRGQAEKATHWQLESTNQYLAKKGFQVSQSITRPGAAASLLTGGNQEFTQITTSKKYI